MHRDNATIPVTEIPVVHQRFFSVRVRAIPMARGHSASVFECGRAAGRIKLNVNFG